MASPELSPAFVTGFEGMLKKIKLSVYTELDKKSTLLKDQVWRDIDSKANALKNSACASIDNKVNAMKIAACASIDFGGVEFLDLFKDELIYQKREKLTHAEAEQRLWEMVRENDRRKEQARTVGETGGNQNSAKPTVHESINVTVVIEPNGDPTIVKNEPVSGSETETEQEAAIELPITSHTSSNEASKNDASTSNDQSKLSQSIKTENDTVPMDVQNPEEEVLQSADQDTDSDCDCEDCLKEKVQVKEEIIEEETVAQALDLGARKRRRGLRSAANAPAPPAAPMQKAGPSVGIPSVSPTLIETESKGKMYAYVCPICQQIFRRSDKYQNHVKTHTAVRYSYHCTWANCETVKGALCALKKHITGRHLKQVGSYGGSPFRRLSAGDPLDPMKYVRIVCEND